MLMMRLACLTVHLKFSDTKIYYPICKINYDSIKHKTFIIGLKFIDGGKISIKTSRVSTITIKGNFFHLLLFQLMKC